MSRQSAAATRSVTISAETQAERVNALAAIRADENGPVRYPELAKFMADQGSKISQTTWFALRDPEQRVSKLDILLSLSTFFGVSGEFLVSEYAEEPEGYSERLEAVNQERAQEFVVMAARHARKLNPEARSIALQGLHEALEMHEPQIA
jgi:hypothetical protein